MRVWWVFKNNGGEGELDGGGQKVQTSSYEIKGTGDVLYNTMTVVNTAIWYIWEMQSE